MAKFDTKEEYWQELESLPPFENGRDNQLMWDTVEKLHKQSRMTTLDIFRVITLVRKAYELGVTQGEQNAKD